MDVSIIIPVYNVERYIGRCLDSVFNQEFKGEYEVIIVDDCSPDSSIDIVNKNYSSHPNLRIIKHPENRKLIQSRLTGINNSIGKYILNLDSDDFLKPNCLEILFSNAEENNADVVIFDIDIHDHNCSVRNKIYSTENIVFQDKHLSNNFFLGCAVNKFCKRTILCDLNYSDLNINSGEDIIFCFHVLQNANYIISIKNSLYVYFQNHNSISYTINNVHFVENRIKIINYLLDISKYDSSLILHVNQLIDDLITNALYLLLTLKHNSIKYNFTKYSNNIWLNENTKFPLIKQLNSPLKIIILNIKNKGLIVMIFLILKHWFKK